MQPGRQRSPAVPEREKLKIHGALDRIETAVSRVVDAVRRFEPSEDHARAMIDAERGLDGAIDELIQHQEAGRRIQELTTVSNRLDAEIKKVIMGLAESRHQLQGLPSYDEDDEDLDVEETLRGRKGVSADELLAYATKITKFTHAPPGYNPQTGTEHANLPWPTEDALRKGMLAIAAIDPNGDEASAAPTDAASVSAAQETSDSVQALPQTSPTESRTRRRSSIVSYGERPVINASAPAAPQAGPSSAVLDLDLFDPDEDD